MYKTQMILQRITSLILLIAAVLVFVYSLGLMTDLYDSLYLVSAYTEEEDPWFFVKGASIYLEMQEFNKQFTTAGIVLILSAVSLFLFKAHDRRRYYIANYITIGINAVLNIMVVVWMRTEVLAYKAQFLKMDFDKLFEIAGDMFKQEVTTSTFWFDVSNFVFGFVIFATVLSILNLAFKISLMVAERKLINEGKEEAHG